MKLAYWMYAGPAHIGTLRVASSFQNVHAIMHAPLGDDYFNVMRSMLERERDFTPVTASIVDRHVLAKGSQEKVVLNIDRKGREEKPDLIILTPTCTSSILQEDLQNFVNRAAESLESDILLADVNHYRVNELQAADRTLEQIVKFYIEKAQKDGTLDTEKTIKPSANIIGTFTLGFHHHHDLRELSHLLSQVGIQVNEVIPENGSTKRLKNLPKAWFNIVPYREIGLMTAQYMEKEFAMPFLSKTPMGIVDTGDFLREIASLLKSQNSLRMDEHKVKSGSIKGVSGDMEISKINDTFSGTLLQSDCISDAKSALGSAAASEMPLGSTNTSCIFDAITPVASLMPAKVSLRSAHTEGVGTRGIDKNGDALSVPLSSKEGASQEMSTKKSASTLDVTKVPKNATSLSKGTKSPPLSVVGDHKESFDIEAFIQNQARFISQSAWFSRSIDCQNLTGKKAFVFGDATHAASMTKILAREMGLRVCCAGTYCIHDADWFREEVESFCDEILITDDHTKVKEKISLLEPSVLFGTQMERHIGKRYDIPCGVISAPVHIQNFPLGYKPFLGYEGTNQIADLVYNSFTLGMEDHLLEIFGGHDTNNSQFEKLNLKEEDSFPVWTEEGLAELRKIPGFVRGKIKRKTENFAQDKGIKEINLEVLYAAKESAGA